MIRPLLRNERSPRYRILDYAEEASESEQGQIPGAVTGWVRAS